MKDIEDKGDSNCIEAENDKKIQKELFKMIKGYATFAYNEEVKREESIKTQASNMQSAFSFVVAALAMIAPVVIDNRGTLSLTYLLIVFSTIFIALAISLLFATMSLKLIDNDFFTPISEQKDYISKNYKDLSSEINRMDYIINYYDRLHISRRASIEERIKYLNMSRMSFIISLGLGAFWFVVSIILITQNL